MNIAGKPEVNPANIDDDWFVKRKGTTDRGKEYEDIKVAQILIHLLSSEGIDNFKVWSNDAIYGNFDDVIAEVTRKNGQITRIAMQLKHSESHNKTVTKNALVSPKGDYSLIKYFEDYQKAAENNPRLSQNTLMLQTNRSTYEIWNEEMEVGQGFVVQPQQVNDPVASIMGNFSEAKPLKFTLNKSKTSASQDKQSEFEQFLDHFYFYHQQPNVDKTKQLTQAAFKKNFLCDKMEAFFNFLQNWSQLDGKKIKLTKELVAAKIAELLVSEHIRFVLQMKVDQNNLLFAQAIEHFDATLINEEQIDKLKTFGIVLDLKRINVHHSLYYLVVSVRSKNVTVLSKALALCKSSKTVKFILVAKSSRLVVPKGDVFRNFDDLKQKNMELYETVGESLKISLQGKEPLLLGDVLEDPKVRKNLNPSHFLQMLDVPLMIGQTVEQPPDNYINRTITNFAIDLSYLDKMDTTKNVALICNCSSYHVAHLSAKIPCLRDGHPKNIYFCNNNSLKKNVFSLICERNVPKNCHCFEYCRKKEDSLQWLESSKSVEDLHEFHVKESCPISETWLIEEQYAINVICGEPGIGKTWFFKSFQRNYPSMFLIRIDVTMDLVLREATDQQYENLVLSAALKEKTGVLEEVILKYLYLKKRIVLLWDNVDAVSPNDKLFTDVLSAIHYFKGVGLRQWIATRPILRERLEKRFQVLSRDIMRFNSKEHEQYMKQQLGIKPESNFLKTVERFIQNQMKSNYADELFGVPQQLFMLTELLLNEHSDILNKFTNGRFSIATLYQRFFEVIFSKCHENYVSNQLLKLKNVTEEDFEKTAMYEIYFRRFRIVNMKGVNFSGVQFFDDLIENGDCYGIITSVIKSDSKYQIYFAHSTYAEFLAARYFTKNYKNIDQMEHFLFLQGTDNIRFFFDVLMAEDSELHLAVLYRDVAKVKRLEKKRDCKDRIGRNPLTLAALQAKYRCRNYYLIPDSHPLPNDARHHVKLPLLPTDHDLAEIYGDLQKFYKLDEKDNFLFHRIRQCDMTDESSPHWTVSNNDLFNSIPGPSYVARSPTKVVAVSSIPCLNDIVTRCVFTRLKD